MVRRMLSYSMVGLLVVALIGGTAYILLNQEENRDGAALSEGHGRGSEAESDAGSSGGRGRAGATETEAGAQGSGNGENGGSEGSGGQGRGSSGGGNSEATDEITWETVIGTVVVADGELVLDTVTGEVIVGMGQAQYWEDFVIEEGDEVSVTGFQEEAEFKAGIVKNLNSGESIVLRDDSGRPMWSGQGRSGRGG